MSDSKKAFRVSRTESVTVVADSLEEANRFGTALLEQGYRDFDDNSEAYGYSGRFETTKISTEALERTFTNDA
jgi:hypothetical protein